MITKWMFRVVLVLVGFGLGGVTPSWAQPSCCTGSGCCAPDGDACVLEYGARGSVHDATSGDPIVGAAIEVLDLDPVFSGADGSYLVAGTRPEQCQLDYLYSIVVSAIGYQPYSASLFTNAVFPTLDIELAPVEREPGYTVSGYVAEFPACSGRMRGVGVTLEPIGLSADSSIDGGEFSFSDVPPGDYVVSVAGCNPFGCWRGSPISVVDGDVQTAVCMNEPTPTPEPVFTFTPCATATPPLCELGEGLRCTADSCGGRCECFACEPCPAGQLPTDVPSSCECFDCPVRTPCAGGFRPVAPCDRPCELGCGCESDSDSSSADAMAEVGSGGGCAVGPHGDQSGLLLVLVALLAAGRSGWRRGPV